MSEQPKVIIRCLVYNHEPYLRDCLEGFVMQQTNFPFKAVVHDDCSTDNSAAIIREYAEKYPHIIEPIYETENQYSKRDDSLRRVMDAATLNRSPYLAYCEGDDYWTDPFKLQKQVEYLDEHPECSMACTNVNILTPTGILHEEELTQAGWAQPKETTILQTEDIIKKGGEYIHTCTIVIRAEILPEIRRILKSCSVGDYPLQIVAALNGSVFYLHEKTSYYRYGFPSSWTGQLLKNRKEGNLNFRDANSVMQMLSKLNQYSNGRYNEAFISTQVETVIHYLRNISPLRKKILQELGWAIRYDYVSKISPKPHGAFLKKIIFIIKRIMIYPYYPFPNALKLILPEWHPIVVLAKLLGK